MTDRYEEWRDFYAEKVRSWMSLEELRAECGKLQTVDNPSPELLLVHCMHALEERVQRDEALLRRALEALLGQRGEPDWHTGKQRENAIDALRDYFAAKFAAAMIPYIDYQRDVGGPTGAERVTTIAYRMADAMLKAREAGND